MLMNAYHVSAQTQGPTRSLPETGAVWTNPWLVWRASRPVEPTVLSVAELADCTCPDLCNRDHANE